MTFFSGFLAVWNIAVAVAMGFLGLVLFHPMLVLIAVFVFFAAQAALKVMCRQNYGKIINISSASGKSGGVAVGAHYAATKAAVICLTKSLALYSAPFGVNVNCVCPGPIKTPMTDVWGEAMNKSFAQKIPFKRYGTPEEVAEAICFLASDRARYITGETMDVNGGLVMD